MADYTKDIGILNFYKLYKEITLKKNKKCHTYKLFTTIIKDFNLILRDKIVYENEIFKMPYKTGELYIKKFENTYKKENKKNWMINFPETKRLGYTVYFGSKYGYKWNWNKKTSRIRGKKFYSFKPCRKASRMIADAINNKKLDYFTN